MKSVSKLSQFIIPDTLRCDLCNFIIVYSLIILTVSIILSEILFINSWRFSWLHVIGIYARIGEFSVLRQKISVI